MSGPNPSTSGAVNWRDNFVPEEIWLDEEEDNTMPFPDKADSKDSEIGLYDELFESDIKSSEKTKVAFDNEDLQKQISHLKSLVAEKDSKLTTMTQHYTNVKKNICSLYKTAKIEIDHKDALLAEANSRLDELLFQRNMTVDQLQTQNTTASHNKSVKSNEDIPAKEGNPKESTVLNKSLLSSDKRTADQPSSKRKRLSSPTTPTSSDNKNAKTENAFQNKKLNCESKNASKSPNSGIQDDLSKTQNISNSNSSKKFQTDDAKENQDIASSNVNSVVVENCDLNSETASESNQEPSIAEVFAKMQELAFKDPEATNAVFFNLLPAELRESFLEFEKTQVSALNKLKQSFVSCYFSQCSGGASEGSSENELQSSTSFFFPDNSSEAKNESCSSSSAVVHSSDSKNKSQENTEVKNDSDLLKSGKIATSTNDQNNCSQPKNESCRSSSAALCSSDSKSKSQEKNISKVKEDSYLQNSVKNSSSKISSDSKCLSQENTKVITGSDLQKSRKRSTSTISCNSSDSKCKSEEYISEETEVIKDSGLQKSTKKSKRRRSPRKAANLYKYKDDNLTLYTQRQLNRR